MELLILKTQFRMLKIRLWTKFFVPLSAFLMMFFFSLFSCSSVEDSGGFDEQEDSEEIIDDGSRLSLDGQVRIFTDEDFEWIGETSGGYAEGVGKIFWREGQRVYEGVVTQGRITGRGTLYVDGELVYVGDFQNGYFEGNGSLYKNGSLFYSGEFKENQYHGYGSTYYPDGSRCNEGEYVNGTFRWLQECTSTAENVGHYIVQEVFDGGINVDTSLISSKIGMNSNNHEIVFNLAFNGDFVTSNHYECKVKVLNSGSETRYELIEKNEQVQDYLAMKGIALTGVAIAGLLSEFDN